MAREAKLAEIPFRREKTLAVGILAFLAPIPLAFSYSLEWGVLSVYLVCLGTLLLAARQGRLLSLPNWVQNAAALFYVLLFWIELRVGARTILKTALHLLLFTALVKLAAIQRERDFSVVLGLAGFLFLASVATSFHYAVLPFVALFAAVAWPILVRWAIWRDLAGAPEEWRRDPGVRELPGARATAISIAASFVLAAPLFFALPRLKAPYLRGVEESREVTTGFSETVDPDTYGILKKSDKVYMRITTDAAITPGALESLRLRTLAFVRYSGRTWHKPERLSKMSLPASPGNLVYLAFPRPTVTGRHVMTIDLTPLGSRYVPYPSLSPGLTFEEGVFRKAGPSFYVEVDRARNLLLPFEPDHTIQYTALYGGPPVLDAAPPGPKDASRDGMGSRRVAAFAREQIAGIDPALYPERAAKRLETVLATQFAYSLTLAKNGPNPVEEFLFERRSGTCESFASAMALALRELGIPARFVTGFVGGELGLLNRYLIVRGENSHAWVEAWCGPHRGWVAFDPTPAAGRPGLTQVPWTKRLRQVTDGVEFLYDRYILGFGQNDQVELLKRVKELTESAATMLQGLTSDTKALIASARRNSGFVVVALAFPIALVGLLVLMRRRRPVGGMTVARGIPPASATYRRLQKALRRRGATLTPASAPGETLRAADAFGEGVGRPAREIVHAYVAESFGGLTAAGEAKRLSELLGRAREALARAS